jgi:signal transduction histidine kinase/ligand-binding sensor domain-containing protein
MQLIRPFFFAFFCIILNYGIKAQEFNNLYDYRNYSTKQGISSNTVTSVVQDFKGYLWFGTDEGLNRFDGYAFKQYLNDFQNKKSINNNYINKLFEDSDSILWIGTRGGGLCKFNRQTDDFTSFNFIEGDTSSLSHSEVFSFFQDSNEYLWVGTDGGGLNLFNKKTGKFTRYDKPKEKGGLVPKKILCIEGDNNGNLYLGTWDLGLVQFNIKTAKYTRLAKDTINSSLISEKVWALKRDRLGNFFIGFFEGGIQYYDIHKKQFISLQSPYNIIPENLTIYTICSEDNNHLIIGSLYGKYLASIGYKNNIPYFTSPLIKLDKDFSLFVLKDKSGSLWSSNYGNGIIQMIPRKSKFGEQKFEIPGEENNEITAFTEKDEESIFIGTSLGTFIFDKSDRSFKKIEQNQVRKIKSQNNYSMQNYNGTVWIARSYDISYFNDKTKTIDAFFSIPPEILVTDRNGFKGMSFKNNTAWFASENGLYEVDLITKKIKVIIKHDEIHNGLSLFQVNSLAFSPDSIILIGTVGSGLITYDPKTGEKKYYQHNPANSATIISNYITQLIVSKAGRIFINTYQGLDEFDAKNGRFSHYTPKNGFTNNIVSIVEDKAGLIWFATERGISKFNPVNNQIWNYNLDNSQNQFSFIIRSAYCASNGYLYFGKTNGYVYFHPDSLSQKQSKTNTLFTNFKINYQPVAIDEDSPLKINIEDVKEIVLNHNQSSFSFSFSSLNYKYPERSLYAYKLENFDKDWIPSGNLNNANYTNIPSGKYIFRVKSQNENGVWDEKGISVNIIVKPIFYDTWLFQITFIILIIAGAFFWYNYRVRTMKLEKSKLELMVNARTFELIEANTILEEQKEEIEQQKEELLANRDELKRSKEYLEIMVSERTSDLEKALYKAKEADALKSSFLSNMSHEIRTPLNAIVGFSNLLSSEDLTDEKRVKFSNIIQSNSDALLILINDILDLSKIEAEQVEIKLSAINVDLFLREIFETFSLQKIKKEVEIRLNRFDSNNQYFIMSDIFRLKQIFNNLLSNAFKFTHKGHIEFGTLPAENDYITFYVRDTGIGIAPENTTSVFERFRKIENNSETLYRGTGLGLSITKKLIDLMGGKIWIESALGKGSTFFFTMPLSKTNKVEPVKTKSDITEINNIKTKKILIVEDIEVNFIYLAELIKPYDTEVLWAKDGIIAIEMSKQNTDIDLILMDIRLPVMNGTEAMKEIRKFNKVVPIIAQTAFALNEQVVDFKKEGFTDHLAKPIKKEEFLKLIKVYLSV